MICGHNEDSGGTSDSHLISHLRYPTNAGISKPGLQYQERESIGFLRARNSAISAVQDFHTREAADDKRATAAATCGIFPMLGSRRTLRGSSKVSIFLFVLGILGWVVAVLGFMTSSTSIGQIASLIVGLSGSVLYGSSAIVHAIEKLQPKATASVTPPTSARPSDLDGG